MLLCFSNQTVKGILCVTLFPDIIELLTYQYSTPLVYDYDTVLPFPCPADEYTYKTFKPEIGLKQQFDRFVKYK